MCCRLNRLGFPEGIRPNEKSLFNTSAALMVPQKNMFGTSRTFRIAMQTCSSGAKTILEWHRTFLFVYLLRPAALGLQPAIDYRNLIPKPITGSYTKRCQLLTNFLLVSDVRRLLLFLDNFWLLESNSVRCFWISKRAFSYAATSYLKLCLKSFWSSKFSEMVLIQNY